MATIKSAPEAAKASTPCLTFVTVGLHLAVYLIGDAGLVQYVGHHLGYTKLHKTLVGHHQCFLQTQSMGYLGQLLACAGTEVGYFIQDKTVYHNCFSFD